MLNIEGFGRPRFGLPLVQSIDCTYNGSGREIGRGNGTGISEGEGEFKLYRALALAALAGGGPPGDRLAQSFQQPFELGLAMLHPGQTI